MRRLLIALVFSGFAQAAAAQPVTIDGLARSVSLMRVMIETCAQGGDLNVDLARRSERAFVEAGERAFGKKNFTRALEKEIPRRAGEAAEAGPEAWCAEQRQVVIDSGGEALFRK
jgi:hypothetical protein